jgi:hypothetical protein
MLVIIVARKAFAIRYTGEGVRSTAVRCKVERGERIFGFHVAIR